MNYRALLWAALLAGLVGCAGLKRDSVNYHQLNPDIETAEDTDPEELWIVSSRSGRSAG